MLRHRPLPLLLFAFAACHASSPAPAPEPRHPAWFLVGAWRSTEGRQSSEEIWTPPHGGVMFGQNRTLAGDRLVAFELLTIEQRGEDLVYVARPNGRSATEFTMTAHDAAGITFENPEHDYPKRIRYRLSGDELEAAIDDGKDGKLMGFGWQRVR